jgi:hypothetical protein
LFDKEWAKDVAAELLSIQGAGFASNIIGSNPCDGDAATEHIGPSNGILMVEGVRDQSSILVGREREWVGPYCSSVIKPCTEAREDGFGHVGADFIGGECVSEVDDGRGAVSNSHQRSGALEDVLKVFVVEGDATRAAPIKGSFATSRMAMAEGKEKEKAKLEFVGSLAVATKATLKGLFQVEPRDVVENRG